MKKIAILDNYWRFKPHQSDFEEYDAHILLNRMLTYYALKNNGQIEIVHPFQINDIAVRSRIDTNIKNMMCNFVNNLPNECWEAVLEELNFKPKKLS